MLEVLLNITVEDSKSTNILTLNQKEGTFFDCDEQEC